MADRALRARRQVPPVEVQRRNKAVTVGFLRDLPEPERVLVLAYVVWGTDRIRMLEEREKAA